MNGFVQVKVGGGYYVVRAKMIQHTYGIFDPQSIELSLPKSTPNLRQVYFVGVVQATVNEHNMLHEYMAC